MSGPAPVPVPAESAGTPKRGRPEAPHRAALRTLRARNPDLSRNRAEWFMYVMHGIGDPEWAAELVRQVDRRELSHELVYLVSRFPPDDQREVFEALRPMGARQARRYLQCRFKAPAVEAIGVSVLRWQHREFPGVPREDVAAALELAARWLRQDAGAAGAARDDG